MQCQPNHTQAALDDNWEHTQLRVVRSQVIDHQRECYPKTLQVVVILNTRLLSEKSTSKKLQALVVCRAPGWQVVITSLPNCTPLTQIALDQVGAL